MTKNCQLQAELIDQKRVLKTVQDAIPDLIFYKDMNSVFLGCNRAFSEKVFGLSEEEIIGKTEFDLHENREVAEYYLQKDKETLLAGKPLKYEDKIVLIDGTVIDLETVKTPFWKDGKPAGFIGIARDITARKRLDKQLREQVEYAELLFKTVPSAVISVDRDRKIIRWNKIAEEITGYSAVEVIGKECSQVLHGVSHEECGLCGKASDIPLINERCTVITKEGQIKEVLKSVAVLKNEFGEISEKMECFEDITGIIKMKAELKESKESYAAIVNNAPQFVVIHQEGIIKFVNDAGKEVLGYDEYIGRHIGDFLTPDSLAYVNSILEDRKRGISRGSYEVELLKQSGEIIYTLLKGTDITFESNKATLAVMIDITESKLLNVKLRVSEEKFRQFAETINEIFIMNDRERILYVSPAFEKIVGIPGQSLLDNPHALVNLIHPADRKRIKTTFPRSFLDTNEGTNVEFRIVRSDGNIRWLWLQSYPVRNEASNSSLKATSIVDITDLKTVEEKLYERERQTQMELRLAAKVQQDSLPHPISGTKVRVDTIFEPFRTVSGDFFNYRWFEKENKLCGYIIDVSGHGVATALQTATFKMMLDNVLLNGETVMADTLKIINGRIMQYLYEDSFVALLYFEFDLLAAELKLISAGITLFMAAKSNDCNLIPISGCYLGIIEDPDIEISTIPLKAGEIYCMMSDGASDLIEINGIRKQNGFGQYLNWLKGLAAGSDRNDDFSVICIEIVSTNNETRVLDIKNDEDLNSAQINIAEFLEKRASIHALTLEVAINEAINNGYYASGRVIVKLRRVGRILIIRVKDNGPGFDVKAYYNYLMKDGDPDVLNEMLEAERGRGIELMKMFCDKVIFNSQGNEVLLVKKI
jgi:PAS domain S-box-containing protein